MKKLHLSVLLSFVFLGHLLFAQDIKTTNQADSTGLPGDNFSLQGALSLFKKATSLEEFEKLLNSEKNYVNNLDLNEDGKTDYILVSDNLEGNSHAIALRVAISESEMQDIAVIEIEKTGEQTADLQIIGDEDIYGQKQIIEPFEESGSIDKKGPSAPTINIVIVNVWFWPCVKFIYAPTYIVWRSPWHHHHYPPYWKPWKTYPWHMHHSHCQPYYAYYRTAPKHRVVNAHNVYLLHRESSVTVYNRTKPALQQHRANSNKPVQSTKPNRVSNNKANHVSNQKPQRVSNNNAGNVSSQKPNRVSQNKANHVSGQKPNNSKRSNGNKGNHSNSSKGGKSGGNHRK